MNNRHFYECKQVLTIYPYKELLETFLQLKAEYKESTDIDTDRQIIRRLEKWQSRTKYAISHIEFSHNFSSQAQYEDYDFYEDENLVQLNYLYILESEMKSEMSTIWLSIGEHIDLQDD